MDSGHKDSVGDYALNRHTRHPSQSYWPADTSRPVLEQTAGEALRLAALLYPERTALVEVVPSGMPSLTGAPDTSRRWTYGALFVQAKQCASWLLTRFKTGERVCVWAPNVPEWVILQYGAAMAGIVLVTANPALRAVELSYVLKQSRSSGLIYTAAFRDTNMAEIADHVAKDVREMFCLSRWPNEVATHVEGNFLPAVRPSDPAQIQYTSGTTGHPKGALLQHRGLVTNASMVGSRIGMDGSIVISPMPLFHTAGAVLSSLGCVTTGSTYVLPLMFDPELIMRAIQNEKCEVLFGVPTMLITMLEHKNRDHFDLGSLRVAVSGGAPVPPELMRRIESGFHCDLLTVYGQTETSPIICQTSPDDALEDKACTAGRPLSQVEVRVCDPVGGTTLPVMVEGEIQARGYQCMLGYFDMPDATAQALGEDGWLRTGDLGTMDSRGYVRVTGRLKDMIIRGGENIYPAELEACLMEHPAIAMAVVFGKPDPKWGETICAAVKFRDGTGYPGFEELRDHCRTKMAPHKTPVHWFTCDGFPMTGSGKVQKFRLRELCEAGDLRELA